MKHSVLMFSYLGCFGLQGLLLLNNLLLQTADLQFETFNLRFLLTVGAQLWKTYNNKELILWTIMI